MSVDLSKYHTVPGTSSNQTRSKGFTAFLLAWIPGIILITMIIVGNVFVPCDTGLGVGLTPFGCDTEGANEYRYYQSLVSLAFMFSLPVSIIMGIIAMVKGSGAGWGFLALIPLPVAVAASFISYTISKASEY